MADTQVLDKLQAIDEVKKKPELAFLNKQYYLLYQSLIPNCKLTIKTLRCHFTITDQVEQYILSGDSRRLRCQRVMDVLLVHLDVVKDHQQFCDWLDSVSVMDMNKIKAEFSARNHRTSTKPIPVTQQRSSNTTKESNTQQTDANGVHDNDQLDNIAMDSVTTICTVVDEVALADKASSCTGSRRRLVRESKRTPRWSMKTKGSLVTGMILESPKESVTKPRINLPLNLNCLLNHLDWSIVNMGFTPLCTSLPADYQSTIERLKLVSEFQAPDQQQQLNSLIPATLSDVNMINERIITFIVVTLSYNSSSGGVTRFPSIMDELLVGSSSCEQEIHHVTSNGASSLPATPLSDSTNMTFHSDIKPPIGTCDQHMSVTMATTVPTTSGVVASVVSSGNHLTEEDVPGLKLVQSLYCSILRCLPTNYGKTLEVLLRSFSDDQVCLILDTPNHTAANKIILDILIEHYKKTKNLSELCDRLEKIMNILPEPGELVAALCDLRAVANQHQDNVEQHQPVNNLLETHDENDEEEEVDGLPPILTSSEDFSLLKSHYHTIVQLMPSEYEQSIEKLQNQISDDQICVILSCGNSSTANRTMLNCLIEKLNCKEDVLDLCDRLEKISNSPDLATIITEIKSGIAQSIQNPGVPQVSSSNMTSSVSTSHRDHSPVSEPPPGSHSQIFQLAFSQTLLGADSKVITILKKNFRGLCRCLPRDHMVTIERLKRRATVGDQLQYDLNNLPSVEERNEMILAIMIKPLQNDYEVLQFCDTIEDVIDEDSITSKKFIQNLRSEVIEVLNLNDTPRTHSSGNQSSGSSPDGAAESRCTSFFDRAIAQHMVVLTPTCKGLVVLKRNFTKLVYCLPHNYTETLTKIKRTAVVPEGLEYQLAILPTAEQANCNILAAMIRPLRKEIHLVGFCDSVENLAVTNESKKIIEKLRFEIIEALSDQTTPGAPTTTPNTAQTLSNVSVSNMSGADVPTVTETMSTHQTSSSEEWQRTFSSTGPPPTTSVTTSTYSTSHS